MALGKSRLKASITPSEDIELIASAATSIKRKKKEKSVHLGASVYEKEMKYIEEVMTMMRTTNMSEATRFLLIAGWMAYGKEIQKNAKKARRLPLTNTKIPAYYKTNFEKILQRINKKVLDDVVTIIEKEDEKEGIIDRVIIIDQLKIENYKNESENLHVEQELLHPTLIKKSKDKIVDKPSITDCLNNPEKTNVEENKKSFKLLIDRKSD